MSENILEIRHLGKSFGTHEVLRDIDFTVKKGDVISIIGASGSGKSTIARLITRQIDATGGQIFIDGQDITRLRGRDLIPVYAKIQMVFQSPADSFDPRRTLGDGICESLRNKGVPKAEREAKARALLESCGLPATFLTRYPHQVSGGQCQRVAIARAIVGEPKLLLADEPTGALDSASGAQVMELFQQLHDRGSTIIMITHDLSIAKHAAKLMTIRDGVLSGGDDYE